MLGILVSRADSASVHVGEQLLAVGEWDQRADDSRPDAAGGGTVYETSRAQLREFDDLHLDLVRPADAFDGIDLLVVVSRHSGETGPLLTAHHTGNVGPADHGGEENELARACPNALGAVVDALEEHAPPEYAVGIECTHHGPSEVGAPSMFVEVGSDQPQWNDPDAARAVARAVLDIRGVPPHAAPESGQAEEPWRRRQLVGVGGGHYAPRFERVVRETDWSVGHVLADWGLEALDGVDPSVFRQAFARSESAYALVDGDRPAVEQQIDSLGYRAVTETWVRETDGVPLRFVRRVEREVMPVEEGLRFGAPARNEPDGYEVHEPPAALLEEARGIDREATFDALAELALAVGTDQGGSLPTGPVVLPPGTDPEAVGEALVPVLEARYDSVERDGAAVVARRQVFDAEKARTLGVPDGPAFGKLAAGEPVAVDGDTVPPEAVHERRTRRFPLSA